MQVIAPWTDEQVLNLLRWQSCPWVHPFTCAKEHKLGGVRLLPTNEGWVCSIQTCDYTQNWAHDHMTDQLPPEDPISRLKKQEA